MCSLTKSLLLVLSTSISGIITLTAAEIQFTTGSVFKKVYTSNTNTVLLEAGTKSLEKCSLLCVLHNEPECSGFYFNSITSTCKMFRGVIPVVGSSYIEDTSSDPIYRKAMQCPFSRGYRLIPVGSSQSCVRPFWDTNTRRSKSSAQDVCNSHGGDLLFVTKEKHAALRNLWSEMKATSIWSCWVANGGGTKYCSALRIPKSQLDFGRSHCTDERLYTCEILL